MSIKVAAQYLGCGQQQIRQLIASGELKYFIVGRPAGGRRQGGWRIDRFDLDALIEKRKEGKS
ncbi:MAG: helix-turn-helix domain-containing protein [Deltaproteobacteria bacterium]|nr:helix-turn-helix domain-containing protein [Deltaproteobacteria bacterium]